MADIPGFLLSGQRARLIPSYTDSQKEQKSTSILLAALGAVPEYSKAMFGSLNLKLGKRAAVDCFTEVVFKENPDGAKVQPDGLVLINLGQSKWSAIVETKTGNQKLKPDQIEAYLQLARANGIDAVVTLSNEFAALPDHHPVKVGKAHTRKVDLFHWSWMFALTQAHLVLDDEEISSYHKRFILSEVVRYFRGQTSGVTGFHQMNPEWKDLVKIVQTGVPLDKSSKLVEDSVASWFQESRDLCLLMSRRLGQHVSLKMPRKHQGDAALRLSDGCAELVNSKELVASLDVPGAAGVIELSASLERRTLSAGIRMDAPLDKVRPAARVNWLLRQLTKTQDKSLIVLAYWKGSKTQTQATLSDLQDGPEALLHHSTDLNITAFELRKVLDIAGKFAGTKTFIERLEAFVPVFYEDVVEHLREWQAPPPKIDDTPNVASSESELNLEAILKAFNETDDVADKERLVDMLRQSDDPRAEAVLNLITRKRPNEDVSD